MTTCRMFVRQGLRCKLLAIPGSEEKKTDEPTHPTHSNRNAGFVSRSLTVVVVQCPFFIAFSSSIGAVCCSKPPMTMH